MGKNVDKPHYICKEIRLNGEFDGKIEEKLYNFTEDQVDKNFFGFQKNEKHWVGISIKKNKKHVFKHPGCKIRAEK